MIKNVEEILDFIKSNGISNEDWSRMYDVAVEYDKNRSKEEKHKQEVEDTRKLIELFKTDRHFQEWCKSIFEIEEYQTALEDFERNFAIKKGIKPNFEDCDAPGEDYYIPCFCHGDLKDGYNPYIFVKGGYIDYYVREDIDDLISDGQSGAKCFAAFWLGTFNTVHMPELYSGDDDSIANPGYLEDYDYSPKLNFYKRRLGFDFTLWGKSSLRELYNEAIQGN